MKQPQSIVAPMLLTVLSNGATMNCVGCARLNVRDPDRPGGEATVFYLFIYFLLKRGTDERQALQLQMARGGQQKYVKCVKTMFEHAVE
jgi:hypothetical protein